MNKKLDPFQQLLYDNTVVEELIKEPEVLIRTSDGWELRLNKKDMYIIYIRLKEFFEKEEKIIP